ncbi:AAA-like domain-containing protein, partial [Planktothrix sp. FACHB-1355]
MICSRDRENNFLTAENLELPGSPISLNSRFYIERPPTEALVYTEISKPGSLIRIRAPRKMGKSSLMLRLLNQAATLGYCTATIDFQQAETAIFESSDKFLRWMCSNLARQLKLAPSLDEYWDEGMGSKVSCTIYLEGYLLGQINAPLVLALNEVNRLFEYPDIAQDFFSLLRFWHEQART